MLMAVTTFTKVSQELCFLGYFIGGPDGGPKSLAPDTLIDLIHIDPGTLDWTLPKRLRL